MRSWITALVFFVVLIAVWQWLVMIDVLSHTLLPTPLEVCQYFVAAARDGTLWDAVLVTMKRLLLGYLAGTVVGVPLGFANARFKICHDSLGLLALGLQTLPSICWAPLALLWFGQTEGAMFFIVVMGTIWSVALATESWNSWPIISPPSPSARCSSPSRQSWHSASSTPPGPLMARSQRTFWPNSPGMSNRILLATDTRGFMAGSTHPPR